MILVKRPIKSIGFSGPLTQLPSQLISMVLRIPCFADRMGVAEKNHALIGLRYLT
ncbi:MAG: hypothetical protein ACI9SK_002138 [Zhongshania sp.]|jgi:hypothetical protein